MNIRIIEPVMAAGKMRLKGKVISIADNAANDFIQRGLAEPALDAGKGNGKAPAAPGASAEQ